MVVFGYSHFFDGALHDPRRRLDLHLLQAAAPAGRALATERAVQRYQWLAHVVCDVHLKGASHSTELTGTAVGVYEGNRVNQCML